MQSYRLCAAFQTPSTAGGQRPVADRVLACRLARAGDGRATARKPGDRGEDGAPELAGGARLALGGDDLGPASPVRPRPGGPSRAACCRAAWMSLSSTVVTLMPRWRSSETGSAPRPRGRAAGGVRSDPRRDSADPGARSRRRGARGVSRSAGAVFSVSRVSGSRDEAARERRQTPLDRPAHAARSIHRQCGPQGGGPPWAAPQAGCYAVASSRSAAFRTPERFLCARS